MKNSIVTELINEMRERIAPKETLANFLTNTLCMGKEAVYRRLRGEVAFTFDEVALISHKLGISIDQIVGNHLSNRATFDLNLQNSPDPIDSYYEILERYLRIFNYVKNDDSTNIYTAANVIPFTLYSSYEHLSKFRLCRWVYQNGKIKTPHSLAEMQVPEKVVTVHKKLNETVKELKNELLSLLHEFEQMSVKGEFSNGNKVAIYLSNINFEATYTYIEKGDFQISLFRVYSINSMDSQNSQICTLQKNWIQSLKRHSTLISESGEVQRITFMEEQKNIIEQL